ncbi:MAG TPA: F0F1 ATP synthase subunit B [Ktedonobacteraceae bacterium]|jgi:F-type H+-transporting ATPase subunit b|nr:F0F1 ATP synthase subunit B [Ktedonobacteraceae bacterium]
MVELTFASVMAATGGLGINAVAFLSQLVSFGIVFLILWRWGFPAITSILDKRAAVIQEGIENAEKAKRDLVAANERAEEILGEARREAQATIERAKNAATQEANRIREQAMKDAERISEQQIARVQQEANRARNELSRLVVNLSIDAAGRVVSRSLDTNDNRRLVEDFVTASNNQSRAS